MSRSRTTRRTLMQGSATTAAASGTMQRAIAMTLERRSARNSTLFARPVEKKVHFALCKQGG